jgi:VanZ family protein
MTRANDASMLIAFLASILIVFGSPYVGEVRGALQSSFPDYYRPIVGSAVAVAGIATVAAAVVQLRQRRANLISAHSTPQTSTRYALVAAAVAASVIYALVTRSGNVDVDLVEAFHFVEYGVVTLLFYRVWSQRPDISSLVLTACTGLAVGIADEWVQWLVPGRVGEMHDVWLNGVAIMCGLMVGLAVRPPAALTLPRTRRGRLTVGAVVAGLVAVAAGFVDRVHLGYEIHDQGTPVFRSQFDAHALAVAANERAERWRIAPPPERGFAREDHYLSEGLWHVQRRNLAVTVGDWWSAWNENTILERFFVPVLDRGARWGDEQRAQVDRRVHAAAERPPYRSDAAPYPIYLVRRSTFWTVAATLVAVIVLVTWIQADQAGRL